MDELLGTPGLYLYVFNLKMFRGGEGLAWCKLGEHQFLVILKGEKTTPD